MTGSGRRRRPLAYQSCHSLGAHWARFTFLAGAGLERETDPPRVIVAYTQLHSSALSPAKSRDLMTEVVKMSTR